MEISRYPSPTARKCRSAGRTIEVEGPKGKLSYEHRPEVIVVIDEDDKQVVVTRDNDERPSREFHGLTRALIANMVEGVTKGYEKRLEIVGVGLPGRDPGRHAAVACRICQRIASEDPQRFGRHLPRPNACRRSGLRQAEVGQFAAEVRSLRKPEPYKGKGVRYQGEQVKIKPGKSATK